MGDQAHRRLTCAHSSASVPHFRHSCPSRRQAREQNGIRIASAHITQRSHKMSAQTAQIRFFAIIVDSRGVSARAFGARRGNCGGIGASMSLCSMGGWSAEREVSSAFGQGVRRGARKAAGYRVTKIDVGRDIATVLQTLEARCRAQRFAWPPGEDGTLQGILEILGIRTPIPACWRRRWRCRRTSPRSCSRRRRRSGARRHGGRPSGGRQGARAGAALCAQADHRGFERRRLHRHQGAPASAAGTHPRRLEVRRPGAGRAVHSRARNSPARSWATRRWT